MFQRLVLVLGGHLLVLAGVAWAEDTARLDWDTWQRMPAFSSGRIMPLDTFARSLVSEICGRENPKLEVDGRLRKFSAAELLFAWLAEPQRWESVPMLLAEHERLRTELLGLEARNEEGVRLKWVSLRQLERAAKFRQRLADIEKRQREAHRNGKEFELSNLDNRVQRLARAYSLFRLLTFDPNSPRGVESRFFDKLLAAGGVWKELKQSLQAIEQPGEEKDIGGLVQQISEGFGKLIALAEQDEFPLKETEPLVVALGGSARALAERLNAYTRRLHEGVPGAHEQQVRQVRSRAQALASQAAELARLVRQMHVALYDDARWGEEAELRLVPALDPDALDADRQESDDAQPWLSFQMLMYGSAEVLRGYPEREVEQVREAYREAKAAYVEVNDPQRRQRFAAAMDRFAAAVRALGERIEPLRRQLPVRRMDEEQLAATAYPPPGYTDAEVRYNRLNPFLWSWIANLAAVALFALSFGVIRRPMFWLATAVLMVAQLMMCYGLGLRAQISGWGPVTGMFETVVFVALCVAVLGVWFTMLPLVWPGLSIAWRLTAMPFGWEATPLGDEQIAAARPRTWAIIGWSALVPRLALAAAIFIVMAVMHYGPGGKAPITPLWPRIAVGSTGSTFDDLLVWLVGMCVLVPSVWYLPRVIMAVLLGLVAVPNTLRKRGMAGLLPQVYARKAFVVVGALVGLLAAHIAYWAPATVLRREFTPLTAALRDNFWLTFHVLPITASYGAGALAWGLANISLAYYLFGRYSQPAGASSGSATGGAAASGGALEACNSLARFTYKATQVAVLLLIAGTVLGALWADVVWGRPWSWDRKEVWALISILVYLAILHARRTGRLGNFGLAVGCVLGFTAIVMAWYGVNFLLPGGLHSYGSGAGGQWEVGGVVLCNWLFLALAALRYRMKTRGADRG